MVEKAKRRFMSFWDRYMKKLKIMVTMAPITMTQPTGSGVTPAEARARASTATPTLILIIRLECRRMLLTGSFS